MAEVQAMMRQRGSGGRAVDDARDSPPSDVDVTREPSGDAGGDGRLCVPMVGGRRRSSDTTFVAGGAGGAGGVRRDGGCRVGGRGSGWRRVRAGGGAGRAACAATID